MSTADRCIGLNDNLAGIGRKVLLLKSVLKLALDMILAALDLVDHRLVVPAGYRRLQVDERAVRGSERRPIILRIATRFTNLRLQGRQGLLPVLR